MANAERRLSVNMEHKIARIAQEINDFRVHLAGPKFTGTEKVRAACGIHWPHIHDSCPNCWMWERKDWISTADVDRWLAGLLSTLND
jgi:hypothetical protein